jgi:hypothetical protein
MQGSTLNPCISDGKCNYKVWMPFKCKEWGMFLKIRWTYETPFVIIKDRKC